MAIMSMENSSDTIGNRNRDLPACIAVPQPISTCPYYKFASLRGRCFSENDLVRNSVSPEDWGGRFLRKMSVDLQTKRVQNEECRRLNAVYIDKAFL
jgi:hypothetical protein